MEVEVSRDGDHRGRGRSQPRMDHLGVSARFLASLRKAGGIHHPPRRRRRRLCFSPITARIWGSFLRTTHGDPSGPRSGPPDRRTGFVGERRRARYPEFGCAYRPSLCRSFHGSRVCPTCRAPWAMYLGIKVRSSSSVNWTYRHSDARGSDKLLAQGESACRSGCLCWPWVFTPWRKNGSPPSLFGTWGESRAEPSHRTGSGFSNGVRTTNLAENSSDQDLYLVATSGGDSRALTSGKGSESDFQWVRSAEGDRVYFLSAKSGSSQAWETRSRRRGSDAGHRHRRRHCQPEGEPEG
jgi:hypothetical protein